MVESIPFPIPKAIHPVPFEEENEAEDTKSDIRLLSPAASQDPAGQRHSNLVRVLKLLLPAIAIALLALVIVWPQLKTQNTRFSMGYTEKGADGEEPRMTNARFTGIDTHGRPYSVTARSIVQIGDSPETAQLYSPQADITMGDNSWVALNAESGIFSDKTHILGLRGSVNLYHDSGYEFHTAAADIDMENMAASGSAPVVGQGPFGHINAEGFVITKGGKRIIFSGKARLILLPSSPH